MSEPFAHHTFTPIKIDGDRRIVAAESEWARVQAFQRTAESEGVQCRVEIGGDLFEPWEGPIYDSAGNVLDSERSRPMTHMTASNYDPMSSADVRRRVFRLIDDCPHITFMVNTTRLEEAARLIPPYEYHACETGDCPHDTTRECDSLAERQYRDNLTLGTTVSTQREIDERLPLLLRLQAAVRWVWCVPGEGLDFLRWFGPQNEGQWMNVVECGHRNQDYGVNWLTIAGSLDSPTNLDHVRDIISQGRAAGVPVWMEGDGVPEDLRVREIP